MDDESFEASMRASTHTLEGLGEVLTRKPFDAEPTQGRMQLTHGSIGVGPVALSLTTLGLIGRGP